MLRAGSLAGGGVLHLAFLHQHMPGIEDKDRQLAALNIIHGRFAVTLNTLLPNKLLTDCPPFLSSALAPLSTLTV